MSSTKITVTYEFLTDIWTNYDGTEQRRCLRQEPRRLISYDYISLDSSQSRWLKDMARKKQSAYEYIPMWHDLSYLEYDFDRGTTVYIEPEYMLGFHNCDALEFFIADDTYHGKGLNITKKIRSYSANSIRLINPIGRRLNKKNVRVIPLIRCAIMKDQTFSDIFSNCSTITYNFEDIMFRPAFDIPSNFFQYYLDIEQYNRFNLPLNFNGRQVFTMSPQFVGDDSLGLSVSKNVERVDRETGIFSYDLKNEFSYDLIKMTVLLRNKKMINNMILFFNSVRGMFKSFYCPTWTTDFVPLDGVRGSSNYIYIKDTDVYRYFSSTNRTKYVVIFTKDWTSIILKIALVTYEVVDDIRMGKVIFSSMIGRNLDLDDILMISYLNLVRFDSDTMQINYESNICASVDLNMREVDDI